MLKKVARRQTDFKKSIFAPLLLRNEEKFSAENIVLLKLYSLIHLNLNYSKLISIGEQVNIAHAMTQVFYVSRHV